MPGFDGWQVLESLKEISQTLSKRIAVYIVSASIRSNDIMKALSYDFVEEYISKPITKENLISISYKIKNKKKE